MNNELLALIDVCNWMNKQGYSPATSGNYSIRKDEKTCLVSASGVDKGNLKPDDFVEYDLDYSYDDEGKKPSDESPVHASIYKLYPEVGCVLHAHSVASTVIGLVDEGSFIEFQNFEMQKAFTGVMTHEHALRLDVIDNTQDMKSLADSLSVMSLPCFLLRGHGVYVWGKTIAQAKRHLEGIEFLLKCKLELKRFQ